MSAERLVFFLNTAKTEKVRRLAEELGIVNDDHSFDEFLDFLHQLIAKRTTIESRS